ncbi:preprotein translocase subunit SecY [Fusobacterium sp. PH5-44]|uniref:preprotein translocase subunit SecY n=1 Tax=unclassified Fusobacterium TaxID=2648384 RepID=UPI003D225799
MTLTERFFEKISAVMRNKELKERIIFTLLMFLVARIGTHIPAPGVDIGRLGQMSETNDILSYINMFSGGAFKRISIFALGIVPYINASIVFSLLAVIIPRIEEIQKEGESGRNRITQWTRYVTILIAVVQGFGACTFLRMQGLVTQTNLMSFYLTTITILTAGTIFLMWVGEQITINGIGNGVSLLIFLNIISGAPSGVFQTIQQMRHSRFLIPVLILVALLVTAVVALIVLFQLGQRKIPIHYVGKGYGKTGGVGDKSYIPLKLNSAGVMPVIFASVAMMLVSATNRFLPKVVDKIYNSFSSETLAKVPKVEVIKVWIARVLSENSVGYLIIFALIIVFFSFFYTAIVFDPEKVADNLKQGGGTIPGIRPGTETVEYLEGVVGRITWGGAFFLAALCILPPIIFKLMNLPVFFQGTGIIIVVGVAIDTVEQINAHLVMRDYKGFL